MIKVLQYKCKSKAASELSDFDVIMIRHCVCVRLTSLKSKSFLHNNGLAPFVSLPKGAFDCGYSEGEGLFGEPEESRFCVKGEV